MLVCHHDSVMTGEAALSSMGYILSDRGVLKRRWF